MYLLSTPIVAPALSTALEVYETVHPASLQAKADAIVVLRGGIYRGAEYGADTVFVLALPRLRYAAYLQRLKGMAILVSGGSVREGPPECVLTADVLRQEFKVPVRWVEKRSRNTQENAAYSAEFVSEEGIERIAVFTHAWHMPRAVATFT